MNSTLRWIISLFGWIILLIIFGIWKSLDKEIGTSVIMGGIRGALVGGGIFFLYHWAKNNPSKKSSLDNSTAKERPKQDVPHTLDFYYKIVAEEIKNKKYEAGLLAQAIAEGGGEKEKSRSIYIKLRVGELNAQSNQRSKQADIFDENIEKETKKLTQENSFVSELLEQGCSKEAIDYLKCPIHIYSYMQKYNKTQEKIFDAIKKGRLRGCYVGEALWVENKKM